MKLEQSSIVAALALVLTVGACGQSVPPQSIEEELAARPKQPR